MLDRQFIFFPEKEVALTPADRGLAYEEVRFAAADGVELHGWWVPGLGDTTWLWFHGNTGNIGHRVDNLFDLVKYLGVNVFIFDYRGYGRSEGSPSEAGLYLDGEAALSHVRSRGEVDPARIVLFGRSLGGAVAVRLATENEAYAVVLESTFSSVRAMARMMYFSLPVEIFLRSRFDSLGAIKDVRSPVMVLHGDRDEAVPLRMGRQLFDAANEPKRFFVIEGAGHNDTYLVGGDRYFEAIRQFMKERAGE